MVKPGYLTTEFWLTVLTDIGTGAALFHHQFTPQPWEAAFAAAAAGIVTSTYLWARAKVKTGSAPTVTTVPATADKQLLVAQATALLAQADKLLNP